MFTCVGSRNASGDRNAGVKERKTPPVLNIDEARDVFQEVESGHAIEKLICVGDRLDCQVCTVDVLIQILPHVDAMDLICIKNVTGIASATQVK